MKSTAHAKSSGKRFKLFDGQPLEESTLDPVEKAAQWGDELTFQGLQDHVQLFLLARINNDLAHGTITIPSCAVTISRLREPSCSPCHCALLRMPKSFRSS